MNDPDNRALLVVLTERQVSALLQLVVERLRKFQGVNTSDAQDRATEDYEDIREILLSASPSIALPPKGPQGAFESAELRLIREALFDLFQHLKSRRDDGAGTDTGRIFAQRMIPVDNVMMKVQSEINRVENYPNHSDGGFGPFSSGPVPASSGVPFRTFIPKEELFGGVWRDDLTPRPQPDEFYKNIPRGYLLMLKQVGMLDEEQFLRLMTANGQGVTLDSDDFSYSDIPSPFEPGLSEADFKLNAIRLLDKLSNDLKQAPDETESDDEG